MDAICVLQHVLHEIFKSSPANINDPEQVLYVTELVWNNMHSLRERLLDFASIRWHLSSLSRHWTNVCHKMSVQIHECAQVLVLMTVQEEIPYLGEVRHLLVLLLLVDEAA